jgi:hypothetical protein
VQVKAQAFAFLRRALDRGYGRDKADADPDLRCLRRHPEFRQLLQEQDLFAAQTKRT